MFLGISMRPLSWVLTLSTIALVIGLPFLAADRLAAMVPPALATMTQIGIGFFCVPLVLCVLHDKHLLGRGIGSIFFYLYKYVFLAVGLAALVYWGITSGDLGAGVPVFGGLMTLIGLMVFYVSWRSDKRHEHEAEYWEERPDAPLDDQTEAILAAAKARAAQPKSAPLVLSEQP